MELGWQEILPTQFFLKVSILFPPDQFKSFSRGFVAFDPDMYLWAVLRTHKSALRKG
jgi:hypothetical protein